MAPRNPNDYLIQGNIYDAHDAPLADVIVKAYDKDLRTAQLLGEAKTDKKGHYEIHYSVAEFVSSEDIDDGIISPDIFILVHSGDPSRPEILGESEIYFNVSAEFTLDYKIGGKPYKGIAEFDGLVNTISPLLKSQHVDISGLKEDEEFKDISFLANETGEDAEKISLLPLAYSHSNTTLIAPDIFYALFRMQYPKELNALLLVSSESLKNGINAAISLNIISSRWEKEIEDILEKFNRRAKDFVLEEDGEENLAFKKIIGAAIPKIDIQEKFVETWFANESTPEKFWETLAAHREFADGKAIEEIKRVLEINLLTGNVPAMTTLLYQEQTHNHELLDIRDFSKFAQPDWERRIDGLVSSGELKKFPDGIEGETPEEKTKNYAIALEELTNGLFPTDVFKDRMSKDNSQPFGEAKNDLITFLSKNPDFNLESTRINSVINESNFEGVIDHDRLKIEIKKVNRIYKLSPKYENISAILSDGLDSATSIVHTYSEDQFVNKFEGEMGKENAISIYKRAKQIDNYSTAIALSYKMRENIPIYAIIGDGAPSPDYQSMFGDNHLCECEHCQSVYSPSAYLVDILNFILRKNNDAFVLLTQNRRPDIVDILLTCKNTHTPLPYIDLVNELLEGFITTGIVAHQTTYTAEELAAYPEHVNAGAYTTLRDNFSSPQLPLNLPLEEARIYLDK